jgi:hypothetical protein
MDQDPFLSELARLAKAASAPNPRLELDIQKVIDALKDQAKTPIEHVQTLEYILRHPGELTWLPMPEPPDPPEMEYHPRPVELEFFEELIRTVNDGAEWTLPSTDQVYRVDKQARTFTLLRDTDHPDSGTWHRKVKACLAALGWKMIDTNFTRRYFQAERDGWLIILVDFSIEDQLNPATPGKNFPRGSRGQDAWATSKIHPTVVRLYHRIGLALIKHALPDYGAGKSVALASQMKANDET